MTDSTICVMLYFWKDNLEARIKISSSVSYEPDHISGGNEMTYFFQCNGTENCKNTDVDEKYCDEEPFVCNGEEYVSIPKDF